jgi:hypothetical protein
VVRNRTGGCDLDEKFLPIRKLAVRTTINDGDEAVRVAEDNESVFGRQPAR